MYCENKKYIFFNLIMGGGSIISGTPVLRFEHSILSTRIEQCNHSSMAIILPLNTIKYESINTLREKLKSRAI